MYNKYLDIFICVADQGSFSKAGEKLFISPNAVMKQINNLERQLDVRLFNRTNHGLSLTPAGKLIYQDAHFLIRHSNATLAKARKLMGQEKTTIRVGSSLMRPGQDVIQLWQRIKPKHTSINLKIVPFNDDHKTYLQLIHHLGNKIDVIYGIYPSGHFNHQVNVLPMGEQKLACAVPLSHHLAQRQSLSVKDLDHQKVIMIKRGDTEYLDKLRDNLEQKHPEIKIIDVDHYDVDTMNFCEENNLIMITTDLWKNIHPALKTIPVNWQYTVPYGLLYPKLPNRLIKEFIMSIANRIQD